eukprot:CAMPEP_0194445318 /NCGR_PEP_ID=MMETSP0176-20130528/127787_1 /TAXON_ID=216777 /ORGANISM="Proboscia alata, Strain PI-D3" /LENGTH=65 /DNA_ID=CAMNT_0039271851 /DNA_START=2020 /DNA_END=2217 /DNA_ORIENTATION=+
MMWTLHKSSEHEDDFVFDPLKKTTNDTHAKTPGRLKVAKDLKVAMLAATSDDDMEAVLTQFGLKD